ncbi:LPS export ABC transporter periplasmic protein LptC [Azomonas macrocytogenes]|uniref:Lipopolysaccharide export system protein LptC n=1 Tax=Azomonas macrocytogenes TaxID=69962 RepID=A0A839T6G7_AZOMA|nr:LPS export ABC transporter periplasmic protein LptC [Azomonas macrocytogenes]MBB3104688.1 lipopolysaccharide export system protein LptC [Azomonas macrocytogenes]
MTRRLRFSLLLTTLAIILAAIGYWKIQPQNLLQEDTSNHPTRSDIDFYVLGSRTVKYLPDGQRQYELTAEKVEHIKSNDISLLTRPDLYVYRSPDSKESPWHVSSEHGEVAAEGKEVELIDKVRVERSDSAGRPLILTTSRLTVLPEKNYAQTQQAVRIEAAEGITTATGMKAYMDESRMHLLSNVRGQHELR